MKKQLVTKLGDQDIGLIKTKSSESKRHNHTARLDTTVSTSCLDSNEPSTSLQSKLFTTPARSKCHNESIRSELSQWIGRDSPGKLNTSKCMVKSKLVRSELSQKPASYFKVCYSSFF